MERHAEALRGQRHEFMNRLHIIAGLIRLQEYDLRTSLQNILAHKFESRIQKSRPVKDFPFVQQTLYYSK
ncbi:Spo0B domain-containing protein [Alicyclobacillus macrosporangiidus]|uniref:Spo0B domain-containing protein n=1 Tax=Alicyclobacillus macrosporangiidus TaxID=392015 RepID=UPI003CCB73F0